MQETIHKCIRKLDIYCSSFLNEDNPYLAMNSINKIELADKREQMRY